MRGSTALGSIGYAECVRELAEQAKEEMCIRDRLGAHQQLLQGVGKATLEEDGLAELAQLPQKVEILHIPCAYLQYIHILKAVSYTHLDVYKRQM